MSFSSQLPKQRTTNKKLVTVLELSAPATPLREVNEASVLFKQDSGTAVGAGNGFS